MKKNEMKVENQVEEAQKEEQSQTSKRTQYDKNPHRLVARRSTSNLPAPEVMEYLAEYDTNG